MRPFCLPARACIPRQAAFAAITSLGLLLAAPTFAQTEAQPPAPLNDAQWLQLEKAIDERANEIANDHEFFEEVTRPVNVRTRLDRRSTLPRRGKRRRRPLGTMTSGV